MRPNVFKDRKEAGKRLAEKLAPYCHLHDVIVLGLPRGGVPVAFEVAMALNAPLDVFIVRKIGVPDHPEFAMGAMAAGGSYHLNQELIRELHISEDAIESVVQREKKELIRREVLYRAQLPPLDIKNRQVILVDDGLATGASMFAAIEAMKDLDPKKIVVAVPVIANDCVSEIEAEVDQLIYVLAPREFYAVGQWYVDFGATSDEEVQALLARAKTIPQPECGQS